MDKIEKALSKLTHKERKNIIALLNKLKTHDIRLLDMKKLRGYYNIFRVRKGRIRVIFRMKGREIFLLKIERRNDTTYSE